MKYQPTSREAWEEQAIRLEAIARRIRAAGARGQRPGRGTLARLNLVARDLGRSAAAYRAGRV